MHTLKKNAIRDSVLTCMRQHMVLFDSFDGIYLFGSILNQGHTLNDIDLLLIYSEYSHKMIQNLNTIQSLLEEICGMSIDVTILSRTEEKEMCFLKRIQFYLKLK